MNSLILNVTARYLGPVLLILSLLVLYRGHNLPGGGFIGGLIAASGLLLAILANGPKVTESRWWPEPLLLMAFGLCLAALSGLPGLLAGGSFMSGLWLPDFTLPLLGKVKLGTPLLFDVGVYFAVIGFLLKCALSLASEVEES